MRAAAADRALELWFADPDPWDTAEGEHELPSDLRAALRELVRSDVEEASFVRFTRTMSRWDDDWLGAADSLSGSPFDGSAAAAVYQAKARGFEEFVKTLASVVAREDPPEWATDERDNLVGSAIASLDPDEADPMATSFGLALIDGGLSMEANAYIDLVSFTILEICAEIDPNEGEPKERFLDLVVQSRPRIGELPVDQQERSGKLLDYATSTLIRSITAARANQYGQVVDVYNEMLLRLRGVPGYQINRPAVRGSSQPAVDFLSDTARMLKRFIELAPDQDLQQGVSEFQDEVRGLLTAFNRLRGS
jgi:hypothetical protein